MNKVDFAVVLSVKNANPNGDPLNGNAPRVTMDGYGYMEDVCIKRKIRNRLAAMGHEIFICGPNEDGYVSLQDRFKAMKATLSKETSEKEVFEYARKKWIDVRAFGQVFAFNGDDAGSSGSVRGAVSIQRAYSVDPVYVTSSQITKSVNGVTLKEGQTKGSDTMGMKHTVDFGVYVVYGTIGSELATKNGLSEQDVVAIKEALCTLFENDYSAARPAGSMNVEKVVWWEHNCPAGQYNTAKVYDCVQFEKKVENPKKFSDYDFSVKELSGLNYEIIEP